MMPITFKVRFILSFALSRFLLILPVQAAEELSLDQVRAKGAKQSKYLEATLSVDPNTPHKADLKGFKAEVKPVLTATCLECHGPIKQKGKFRIDTLDPDLVHGQDVSWCLEVMGVLNNGEMPPEDEPEMVEDRSMIYC